MTKILIGNSHSHGQDTLLLTPEQPPSHQILIHFWCSVVELLSHVQLFVIPWTAACSASLHYLPEFAQTYVQWVGDAIQPFHPLWPLLLLPSIFPSIRVFSNELALRIRWPKYWSFSILPCSEYSGLISYRIDGFDLLAVQVTLSRVFSSTTIQKHQFFGAQSSLWSNSHIHRWLLEKPQLWWTLANKVMSLLFNKLSRCVKFPFKE